jgi:hypothetical protein
LDSRDQERWLSDDRSPRRRDRSNLLTPGKWLDGVASYDRARIKGKSFTLDGEAVVIGADGLSRFDELRRVEGARVAFLYTFDFLEHDGDDLREQPDGLSRLAISR